VIARNGYSTVLDNSLFETKRQDEIILCLNYDGLYGINNVNRFLQSSNPNPATTWRDSTYKVGDPVLFNETERFWPVIHNNHKAQGLEYDSVKIVITDANEDDITHSIFYTAVTRAREALKIFWTPETQQAVLDRLKKSSSPKDIALLSSRRGLTPVAGAQRAS